MSKTYNLKRKELNDGESSKTNEQRGNRSKSSGKRGNNRNRDSGSDSAGRRKDAMVPQLPHAKNDTVEIPKSKILVMFEPITELANEYSTKFGSGLVVPPPVENLKIAFND